MHEQPVPDARAIADAPIKILATFAEFEADPIRIRAHEGMASARAKGKLRGKSPKLSDEQQQELRRTHDTGDHSVSDPAYVFSVSRPNRC